MLTEPDSGSGSGSGPDSDPEHDDGQTPLEQVSTNEMN